MSTVNPRLSMLVALVLCMSLLAACAGNNQATGTPDANGANVNSSTAPDAQEPDAQQDSNAKTFDKHLKLSVFNSGAFNPATPMPDKAEDPLRQMLEEAVNIELDYMIPAPDQADAMLNALIASGDIPDLIYFKDRATAVKYYEEGVTADFAEQLEQYPDYKAHFTEQQWSDLSYNGKQIGAPAFEPVSGTVGWWIRQDWLDALGLEIPQTTDELLEVMKAFTFEDPDGNGQQDTYGFVAGVGKDGSLINLGWGEVFWLFGAHPEVVDVKDGELVLGATDDRTREALAYISEMVDSGVVDPDWVSINDVQQLNQKMFRGKVGMLVTGWRLMEPANQKNMQEIGGEVPEWVTVPPVEGPYGDRILGNTASQSNSWGISVKAARDPEKMERIFEFLQYWYTDEEARKAFSYGIEGVQWHMEGDTIVKESAEDILNNYRWTSNYYMPRRADDELYYDFQNPDTAGFHQVNLDHVVPNPARAIIVPDPDDRLYSDRQKYISESLLRFMTGRAPLSQWEDYKETLTNRYDYENYRKYVTETLAAAGVLQ
ncbi:hypothetical protein [Paenibacillus sp. 1P07SE]|uniref:hypothetical protein n=1 Tax=Paenibacillus sp. 1P07SE TaxID=3132209 RepID=UPI0039A52190